MVDSLKKALGKLEQLSKKDQEGIAQIIEHEIAWLLSFKDSADALVKLADEAEEEYRQKHS